MHKWYYQSSPPFVYVLEKLEEPEVGLYCMKYLVKLGEKVREWSILVFVHGWALCFLVRIIVRVEMMRYRLCLTTELFIGKRSCSSSFSLHVWEKYNINLLSFLCGITMFLQSLETGWHAGKLTCKFSCMATRNAYDGVHSSLLILLKGYCCSSCIVVL